MEDHGDEKKFVPGPYTKKKPAAEMPTGTDDSLERIILFLRQYDDESKPFYTTEIRNRQAVQVRGLRNYESTLEVRKLVG